MCSLEADAVQRVPQIATELSPSGSSTFFRRLGSSSPHKEGSDYYYLPFAAFIWTGGGAATLNLTTGAYQFQVKYLSWAMPINLQPIGATLDNTIALQALFVCDSLGDAFPLGPVPFSLDKTGSANIQGVLTDKSLLPTCADKKDTIAFLILDESDHYFVFGTGRQVVTSTQNNQK